MQITLDREKAVSALSKVAPAVMARATIPILGNVLLDAKEDGLRLTTTSIDTWISSGVDGVAVKEPGSVTIPLEQLLGSMRASDARETTIVQTEADNDRRALVQTGRSRLRLPTLPADQFPRQPHQDAGVTVQLPASELLWMLDRSSYKSRPGDGRFDPTYFTVEEGVLRLSGGANSGVAYATRFALSGGDVEKALPSSSVKMLRQLLKGVVDADVAITLANARAFFSIPDAEFVSAVVAFDGAFPAVRIAEGLAGVRRFTVDVDALQGLLRRALIVNATGNRTLMSGDSGTMRLRARGPNGDQIEEELEGDQEGDAFSLEINAHSLLNTLALIETESVILEIADNNNGFLTRETSESRWLAAQAAMTG